MSHIPKHLYLRVVFIDKADQSQELLHEERQTRSLQIERRDIAGEIRAREHIHCAKAVVTRNGLLSHPLLKLGFAVKSGGNKSKTNGGSSPIMEES